MINYLKYLKLGGIGPLFGAFVVISALLPFMRAYYLEFANRLFINLLLVSSFWFIITMGRWSFVHVSLMGLGGYATGILTTRFDVPFWFSIIAAGLVVALVGLLLSYPCLRTRGFYFFMSTFISGLAIQWTWNRFIVPFGGTAGISNISRPNPISIPGLLTIDFESRLTYCYLVMIIVFICLVIIYRLQRTRLGTILKAIASDDSLAKSIGINLMRWETLGFIIGCFFAAICGVLHVHNLGVCFPTDFTTTYAINILSFALVGGISSFWGPLLGTILLMGISELTRSYLEYVPLIYGVTIILAVMVLPGGLVSLPHRISEWRQGKPLQLAQIDKIPILRNTMQHRSKRKSG